MLIIPAIDLQDSQAVRLYKGDYAQKTVYSSEPWQLAQNFERMGATYLHMVDLDGAKEGTTTNLETIRKIRKSTNLKIQLGGGIRTLETAALYLENVGIDRVILGTAALTDPAFLKAALAKYGAERIIVGVDIKNGFVSTSGWLETSSVPYLDFLESLEKLGVRYSVITDISKDGTLAGPNFALYKEIAAHSRIKFIVSGGVKDKDDVLQAASRAYYAVIIGKAYYEGKINLEELFHAD